jgi:hypothetical protein
MTISHSPNAVLGRAVAALGGPFELAGRLWPAMSRQAGYDRVYQWLRRGRVPGTALGPLVGVMRAAGLAVTDDDISALGGAVTGPPTTECRQGDGSVKCGIRLMRQDAA